MNNEHHECQSIFIASLRLNQSNFWFFIKIYIVYNRPKHKQLNEMKFNANVTKCQTFSPEHNSQCLTSMCVRWKQTQKNSFYFWYFYSLLSVSIYCVCFQFLNWRALRLGISIFGISLPLAFHSAHSMAWCLFLCKLKFDLLFEAYGQNQHSYGFKPLWRRRWP